MFDHRGIRRKTEAVRRGKKTAAPVRSVPPLEGGRLRASCAGVLSAAGSTRVAKASLEVLGSASALQLFDFATFRLFLPRHQALNSPLPFFSVIVPTFNRAHLLDRCIASVQSQTYSDLELIVADDGSTDDTENLVGSWMERDDRIRYVRQENKGAGDARNLGASVAHGEYLLFLDSDDEVEAHWLECFGEVVERTQATVICCGCKYIREDGVTIRTRLPTHPGQGWRYGTGFFFTGTFAVKREVFKELGGYAPGLPANQHSELRLRLLPYCERHGWEIACIDRALVKRYSHDGPSIRGNLAAVYESGVFILTHHREQFQDNPTGYVAWATSVGCCAAKMGRFADARRWFFKASRVKPTDLRPLIRLIVAASPVIRRFVWRPEPQRVRRT